MVNDSGQLYTIEGVAAAILLVFTAYLIISTTNILTPGDTHINDMQLEQLGNDVLAVMDLKEKYGMGNAYETKESALESYIMTHNIGDFGLRFNTLVNERYEGPDPRPLSFSAEIWYRKADNSLASYPFGNSRQETGTENSVKVSRWVHLSGKPPGTPEDMRPDIPQSVLLEVTLWRD